MNDIILLLSMIFLHIVDDYYLQGILAQMKQKQWWIDNAPKELYKHDYIMALIEHAFSWTFMIHIPLFWVYHSSMNIYLFAILFVSNWIIHAVVDNAKANKLIINLCQDQIIHIIQIIVLWVAYVK